MAPLVGHLLVMKLAAEESGGLQEGHPQGLPVPFVNAPATKVLDAPVIAVHNEDADSILVLHLRFLPWVTGGFIFVVIGRQMEGQVVKIFVLAKVYFHDGKKSEINNRYCIIQRWDAPLDKCMLLNFPYCSRKVVTS